MTRLGRWTARVAPVLPALALLACGEGGGTSEVGPSAAAPAPEAARVVVAVGDIEPYEPAWRIERLQPLAQLLADRLESGERDVRGRVVVARDIGEMGRLMERGEVDLLFDSPHPILAVRRAVGGEIVLQREVRGATEYVSVFIARVDSEAVDLPGLEGGVVALQERHSTSGFLLPALALASEGLELRQVAPGRRQVGDGEVGYYFTRDEENTIEAVISGAVLAGAVSSQDLQQLPPELGSGLRVIHRTPPVPRQLVLARPGLSAQRTSEIAEILRALDDADRRALGSQVADGGWSWKFSDPSAEALQRLEAIERRWPELGQEVGTE